MKIGVSAFAGDCGKSEITQYMKQLFKLLPLESYDDEFILFMTHADRKHFGLDHPRVTVVAFPDWMGKSVANIIWHLLMLPLLLAAYHCDCVFLPAANRCLSWWYGVPSVGTVHDISSFHTKGRYNPIREFYASRVLPLFMRQLTQVIAVSQATRRDLEQNTNIESTRIDVIYNGTDLDRFRPRQKSLAIQRVRQKHNIRTPYILYTARLEHPSKNHIRLLQAFAQLKNEQDLPHDLVLAGSPWYGSDAIYAAAGDLRIARFVHFPGFVSQQDLPDLYAAADLFVFPSLFEGFGLPLLEAMASATPLCASNVASIPEIVQNAGLLFNPQSSDDIAQSIARLAGDAQLRDRLVDRALKQARRFSWNDSASQVLQSCHTAADVDKHIQSIVSG